MLLYWSTVLHAPISCKIGCFSFLSPSKVKKFMVGFEMLAQPQRDITAEQVAAPPLSSSHSFNQYLPSCLSLHIHLLGCREAEVSLWCPLQGTFSYMHSTSTLFNLSTSIFAAEERDIIIVYMCSINAVKLEFLLLLIAFKELEILTT